MLLCVLVCSVKWRFKTVEPIKGNVSRHLMEFPKVEFEECFEKWNRRQDKRMMSQREYSEVDNTELP